jgi:ABC-type polysaccharide/polyol phosphate export permease
MTTSSKRYSPLGQLVLARLREFFREPEALFWVYGFPIVIVVALGIAFRNKPVERITVDLQKRPGAEATLEKAKEALARDEKVQYVVQVHAEAECRLRLRTGKTDVVVIPAKAGRGYDYAYDPTRPESTLARSKVDDTLQRAEGRKDVYTPDPDQDEPGSRYVDFLIPGLLGMSLMGGGMFGVGFAIVEMRMRKVLKRFLATPMRRSHFLMAMLLSRLVLLAPEVFVLLIFARIAFGVVIQGSLLAMAVLILLGAITFSGIGLLVASRAKTLEAVSGLMNLTMLPMWILSGVFFSPDRFPEAAQPFIQALPLTPLIDALRNVSLEGAGLESQWRQIAILATWSAGSFFLALRWFRWN